MNVQQPSAPLSETQQSRILRRIVGVVLPLVAGTALWWIPSLFGYADIMDNPTVGYTVIGVTIALAFAGAAVLRSWWALLIVPAAWLVGEILAALVTGLATASVNWVFLPLSGGLILYVGLPVVISAGLGVLFGQWLARRGTARGGSQTPLSV